ncbi:MAG: OmpH family outer membrane protein, partial [Bacteroidales bacterium]
MKRLPLILSAVSILAVGLLYVLHFTDISDNETTTEHSYEEELVPLDISSTPIAYINIDTVVNNYDLYYDLKQKFERKYKTSEAELASKEKAYKKDVEDYQYKVQRGLVTRSDAQKLEQQILNEQQNLLQLQENLRLELAEEEQVMLRQVLHSITTYLQELQSEYKYQFVFGTTAIGGNVLYADRNLDITRQVIRG